VAWAEGQFAIAEDYLRRSLAICEQHGFGLNASGILERLASLIEARGDLASAVGLYEEAMQRLLREGRTLPLCGHLLAQAKRYLRLNQPEVAEACLRQSICEGREMGMSRHLMEGLNKLAMEFLCPRGMFEDARSLLQEAMSLAVQIGHRRIYGEVLNSSALLSFSEGNLDEALRQGIESLQIAEELNHAADQANARLVLGHIETARGAFAQALPHLTEGRRIFLTETRRILQENKKPENMARCLLALGEFYRRQGQWQEAETCYREAKSYATREDLRCHILHAWATLHEACGQRDIARAKWQTILPICRVWKLRLAKEVEAALRRLETTIPTGGFVLHLFGPLELRYNGQPVPLQSLRSYVSELLAYLALHQGEWLSYALIWETLWPRKGRPRSSNHSPSPYGSLHTGMSQLRKAIRQVCTDKQKVDNLLCCRNECYCFDPDGIVWNDWRELNRTLENADRARNADDFEKAYNLWEFADSLYRRGELLADWGYTTVWARKLQTSTETEWLKTLECWSKVQYQRGEYEAGVAVARRILNLDPAVEAAHQLIMKCLARLGRRAEALRQYEDCARALRAVNKSPSHETQQLYRQIRGR
ncbi:tetratricopeptide repeat protein, partial [Candidatus Poribacteria bacterium]|nr:tetratricopeptide repeat protein [Candidatus Poribacteria bacterium]